MAPLSESLPRTNYVLAFSLARKALAGCKDPDRVSRQSGCRFDKAGSFFEVPFLGRVYRVEYPGGGVTPGDPVAGIEYAPPVPAGSSMLTTAILVVHYLTKATGLPVAGEWIAFRELPGGDIYNAPFANRTIRPMVARFGSRPQSLVEAILRLGGRREKFGHASASIDVFPRLPLCLVVWEGDDEIPSSGQILFDRSASGYLDTEDLVVAAGETFLATRAASGAGPAGPGSRTLEPE